MNAQANMQAILNQFLPTYQQRHTLSVVQERTCNQLIMCRTAALGGQYVTCDHCEFEQIRYHSCRNRHCPQCQQRATQDWCNKQTENLLPENYYHLVFTLPHELNDFVKQNPALLYRLLFQSAWQTIKAFGADKKRLNGQMGMTAVLHTWGQNLSQHVHLHCLIPGGALSADEKRWHQAKGNYLFPVKALSRVFRGKMVSAIRHAREPGELSKQLNQLLDALMTKDWVVYAKSTLNKAQSVVRYLARYTKKAAISNSRIISVDEKKVLFQWKDYRDEQQKTMQLNGEEFIRRYLLHVLPKGFMRVRHFGFLANRCRANKLACIRDRIQARKVEPNNEAETNLLTPLTLNTQCLCPKCRRGALLMRYEISPKRKRDTKR